MYYYFWNKGTIIFLLKSFFENTPSVKVCEDRRKIQD